MADLFRNYHKHKVLSNISIIAVSFILAISINMLLVGNNSTQMLKASVIDANQKSNLADITIEKGEGEIILKSNSQMNGVKQVSFSLAYDFDEVVLTALKSELSGSLTEIENEKGFRNIVLNFGSSQDIVPGTEIASTSVSKEGTETVYINMIQSNFTDTSGEVFLLSSSGLIY